MKQSSTAILLLFSVLILSGCESTKTMSHVKEDTDYEVSQIELTGKQAYQTVCAKCHEKGINGAPRSKHKEDWVTRSWLWEGVIFEHAKEGFLDMPAKGGVPELDDATVERAAEYMLSITFPKMQASEP